MIRRLLWAILGRLVRPRVWRIPRFEDDPWRHVPPPQDNAKWGDHRGYW